MATSAELAAQISQYDANKKSSADILNAAMAQYGVPEIRTRVAGLRTTLGNTETALNNVDPSVTGRTSRSLVTEAQRSRIVANERAPIAAQYGDQSKALTTESANLTDQQQAANTLAQGQINDYTIGRSALQSQYEGAVGREAEAQRIAEADRAHQFNLQQQADANRNAAANRATSGAGKTPAASNAEKFAATLSAAAGADGKVSPGDYNALKQQWVASGYGDYKSFHDKFWRFVNESHWWDYK